MLRRGINLHALLCLLLKRLIPLEGEKLRSKQRKLLFSSTLGGEKKKINTALTDMELNRLNRKKNPHKVGNVTTPLSKVKQTWHLLYLWHETKGVQTFVFFSLWLCSKPSYSVWNETTGKSPLLPLWLCSTAPILQTQMGSCACRHLVRNQYFALHLVAATIVYINHTAHTKGPTFSRGLMGVWAPFIWRRRWGPAEPQIISVAWE